VTADRILLPNAPVEQQFKLQKKRVSRQAFYRNSLLKMLCGSCLP